MGGGTLATGSGAEDQLHPLCIYKRFVDAIGVTVLYIQSAIDSIGVAALYIQSEGLCVRFD
jgi:hypothetical protein